MRRRHRRTGLAEIKLTPEGWVFLVVLVFITVGAVLRNVNLLIAMVGMMYAPILLNWRMAVRWVKSMEAARRMPSRINANEIANVQWACENRFCGFAAWNVVVNDSIEGLQGLDQTLEPLQPSPEKPERWMVRWFGEVFKRFQRRVPNDLRSEIKLGFVRIDAGRSEVQSYRVFFARRGKYVVGPATLSTTFPFGLIVCRIHIPAIDPFFVGPEIGQLDLIWERRLQSIATGSESVKRQRSLEEEEFYALRPWRSGDSKKNIHWRTSAKFGQPIVKQFDQPKHRDFAMVLDLYSDGNDPAFASRCELALSFVASVMLGLGKSVLGQISIGVCGEQTEQGHSRSYPVMAQTVHKWLAVAKAYQQPELPDTLIQLASTVSRGTPIYVVSSRPRPNWLAASQLAADTGGRESDQQTKRLKRILPMLRWLEVDSDEFRSMFGLKKDSVQEAQLTEFSSRWAANARR